MKTEASQPPFLFFQARFGQPIADLQIAVIACDKREAFAQGSRATKQSIPSARALWIASRSLSSGAHSRDPLARNDVTQAKLRGE
jgi:hypothetical protein